MLTSSSRVHLLLRRYLSHFSHPSLSFFSSTPESLHSNNLSLLSSAPTHQSIIYILKKLDKKPQEALKFFNFATSQHNLVPSPAAHNLMLRILARKDHLTDFWAFLNSMQDASFPLDEGTYRLILACFKEQKLVAETFALTRFYHNAIKKSEQNSAVDSAAKIVVDAGEWSEEAERKMGGLELAFSEDLVARIVRELRDFPLKALAFFRWVDGIGGYEHGPVAYNAAARVVAREECVGEFWRLVEEMRNDVDMDMDIDTYVKVTRQFLRRKMVNDAVQLYEFMMDGPYKPAIQDCGMLLRQISLSSSPDLDLVFRVVKKYEAAGYALSKVVYDGIHRSLASTAKFDEAMEIMKKMREEGHEPDNVTYSQLVYGLCKAKRLDDAVGVLEEMERGGCAPDLKTWTVLIQGFCSAGDVDGALECLAKMIGKKCDVDADVVDVLVKGLCGKKRFKSAYTLMVEMIDDAQVRPWQATYKYLVQELLGVGKLEEALKLLGVMKKYNVPPYSEPFAGHISKFGTTEDAKEFLKILSGKSYPSSTTYLNVFKAFFEQGRYTEAQDLLFKCPHHIRKLADVCKLFGSVQGGNAT